MNDINLSISKDSRPHYLRIAEGVRSAIRKGQVNPGESLPSSRVLAECLSTHRQTIMAAMEELAAEGWITAQSRRRYRICETLPNQFFEPRLTKEIPVGDRKWRLVRGQNIDFPPALPEKGFSFKSGMPDLRIFPVSELRSCLADVLARSSKKFLNYDQPEGQIELLDPLRVYLRRVRAVSGRQILVTNGSQEAIYLLGQLLIAPGDKVGVEEKGYRPAWEALRAAGAELVPIPIDEEGIDPDALHTLVKRHRLRLVYSTPLHQYPTTVTLPVSRRIRIYELLSQFGVPFLEDDYDHEFHYRCQPLAPLAASDPEGLILYVSTFSKVLFPSARLGFMAVPASIAKPLASLKRISTRQNDGILQAAVGRWMKEDGFERHLRRMRRRYEERRNALVESLEAAKAEGYPVNWKTPDGGMALWLDVGQDSDALSRRAQKLGVYVTAESQYHLKPSASRFLRLGFANQTPEEIRGGIKRLLEAFR